MVEESERGDAAVAVEGAQFVAITRSIIEVCDRPFPSMKKPETTRVLRTALDIKLGLVGKRFARFGVNINGRGP